MLMMSQAVDVVGVFGAGFMGSGIAESSARAGLDVLVYEPGAEVLDRSRSRIDASVGQVLVPYLMAAVRMYEEGFASREDIDAGMKLGCGHPMGPLALCDFIGLDVLYAVCDSLYDEFKRDEYAPPPLMKRTVAAGRLGRKSGRGFYDYADQRVKAAV
jgi:3-hydroxybutyryl-CoA dehydrogenase